MLGPKEPDRLAVRTFTDLGDEIAFGDPSVSDRQRAAAGRETIAERTRDLREVNRRRAAERYRAGGEEPGRVWFPRDPRSLRSRLGADRLAVWAEHDVLHVLWRGRAERVDLAGGVQPQLWPVPDTEDLWEASLRVPRLDEAMISVLVVPASDGDHPETGPAMDHAVWRGRSAPSIAVTDQVSGQVEETSIDSVALGGARAVTVYRPPSDQARLPVCILADGQSVPGFAATLEAAVRTGEAPAVLLVGIHSAVDQPITADQPSTAGRGGSGLDGRAREYLPGQDRRRFAAHLRFVTDEVIPWLDAQGCRRSASVVAAGYSNGAAWAIGAAQRRPDVFEAVAALSPGVVPTRISGAARGARVRHYLANGRLEPGFRRATLQWAQRLDRAGLPYHHHEWAGGHDHLWWAQQLPVALDWLLRPHRGRTTIGPAR